MYDHYFSNFGSPPVPKIYAKIQPLGMPGFGEEDF